MTVINDVISEKDSMIRRQKLKTMVGHTPLQVVLGAVVGLLVAGLYIWLAEIPYQVYV